jgi:FAD/FMN-containing dehydrogenase
MTMSMTRHDILRAFGWAALLPFLPRPARAGAGLRRCRPTDAAWPSRRAWQQLDKEVGGNLFAVKFPLASARANPAEAQQLWKDLKNPYYIGEQPGLTQTLGWVDAWTTHPSVYAVAARNAHDIAAAVNFARNNNLRLVVKGGGHSYLGASNAPDSLLVWTRHMNEVELHEAFVPQGCAKQIAPQPAVTVGAGTIDIEAYDAVTTRGGKYVQGGGCLTVGLAGLLQGGGFGSFSKHYGTAAASLLQAEVITADGEIRIANACTNPDLFWALKGGGGGTFGVISKMTLRLHDLPDFFGSASFTVKAASDAAFRRLIGEFLRFYRTYLFNEHWGEQVHLGPDNTLAVKMDYWGLDTDAARSVWRPFLDWLGQMPDAYSIQDRKIIASVPGRHWWDAEWWKAHWPEVAFPIRNGNWFTAALDYTLDHVLPNPALEFDDRPGAKSGNVWWAGNTAEVGMYLWGYDSLWLPASLLADNMQSRLADALFASSRAFDIGLHFNKGLAGAPPEVIAAAKDTAMNPAVLTAFALVIAGDGQDSVYPGTPGHEPQIAAGRAARARIDRSMSPLRALVPDAGSYVNETNYFAKNWQDSFWGSNYSRLAEIKRRYDSDGLFFAHHGVGSEDWSPDGFTRIADK